MNIELIKRVALRLRRLRHEEHYDQGKWVDRTSCGTSACIAGHALLLAGVKIDFKNREDGLLWYTKGGKDIHTVAMHLLGLSYLQAEVLFAPKPAMSWPGDYADRWEAAQHGTKTERPSRIAADLLDALADGKALADRKVYL